MYHPYQTGSAGYFYCDSSNIESSVNYSVDHNGQLIIQLMIMHFTNVAFGLEFGNHNVLRKLGHLR